MSQRPRRQAAIPTDAYAALGRALAKATLFCLTAPERAVELVWRTYPDAAPTPGQDKDSAFRGELAALRARLAGHRIEQAPLPKWGAITGPEMAAWQEFLLDTGAIRQRRDPLAYYSDTFAEDFNAFDPVPVVARALSLSASAVRVDESGSVPGAVVRPCSTTRLPPGRSRARVECRIRQPRRPSPASARRGRPDPQADFDPGDGIRGRPSRGREALSADMRNKAP